VRTKFLLSMTGALFGAPVVAWAQPDPGYTVVPPGERLTFADVIADAAPEVQIMMALMFAGAVGAVAVWALSLGKVGKGDAKAVAGALGRLKIVRSGAAPLGFLTAAYVLFSGFLGIANVRPAPTLTILAPGFAEATLAIMLGLLASAVAVICERHLEGRVRRAAA
jgi:hypothetical protein